MIRKYTDQPSHLTLNCLKWDEIKKKMRKKILREKDEVLGKSARFDLIFCRIFNSKMKKESFMFGITWKEKMLTLLESSIRKSSGPRSSRKLSVSLFRCKWQQWCLTLTKQRETKKINKKIRLLRFILINSSLRHKTNRRCCRKQNNRI